MTKSGGSLWTFNALGALTGTLAIVSLVHQTFLTGGLTAPMKLVLSSYSAVTLLLFGWAEPTLKICLAWLGAWIDWQPILHPHWRDFLMLSILMMTGILRDSFRSTNYVRLTLATGGIVAAISAALAGTVPLEAKGLLPTLLLVMLPTAATLGVVTVLNDQDLKGAAAVVAVFAIPVTIAALFLEFSSWTVDWANKPILALIAGIVVMGLLLAADEAYGLISGFCGAILFLAVDAGIKQLGG